MKIFFVDKILAAEVQSYGFHSHAIQTRDALERAGVLTQNKAEADFALYVGPPYAFKPQPGMKNICYTAVEGIFRKPPDMPLMNAGLLLVPCEMNRRAFAPFHPSVHVVPLGIDPVLFPYVERKAPSPDEPFRFLFLGSIYPQKGAPTLIQAFEYWQNEGTMPPNAELVIKSSVEASDENGKSYRGLIYPRPGTKKVIIDNRNLPFSELLDIYKGASVFCLPSYGEGWGLSLSEAAATGLPCIYTGWSAPLDYLDETVGYPLKSEDGDFRVLEMSWGGYDLGAKVSVRGLARKMQYVYEHYTEALARGQKASERMHSEFTWDKAAQKLIKTLEEVHS